MMPYGVTRRRTMEYKNILIIKMSALGDVMHALPCAAALRDLYPKARITWIVHPQFSAFIPEAPIVDEVIIFDKKAFGIKSKRGIYVLQISVISIFRIPS